MANKPGLSPLLSSSLPYDPSLMPTLYNPENGFNFAPIPLPGNPS